MAKNLEGMGFFFKKKEVVSNVAVSIDPEKMEQIWKLLLVACAVPI